MRSLILLYCVTLAGCDLLNGQTEYRIVPLAVPDALTAPLVKPARPLVTYKDAVLRDAERGETIEHLLEDRAAVRAIILAQ